MTSLKRIEANRRNAMKSTGPKTEAGRSSADAMRFAMDLRPRRLWMSWRIRKTIRPSKGP